MDLVYLTFCRQDCLPVLHRSRRRRGIGRVKDGAGWPSHRYRARRCSSIASYNALRSKSESATGNCSCIWQAQSRLSLASLVLRLQVIHHQLRCPRRLTDRLARKELRDHRLDVEDRRTLKSVQSDDVDAPIPETDHADDRCAEAIRPPPAALRKNSDDRPARIPAWTTNPFDRLIRGVPVEDENHFHMRECRGRSGFPRESPAAARSRP
jgi:hypothetical protein